MLRKSSRAWALSKGRAAERGPSLPVLTTAELLFVCLEALDPKELLPEQWSHGAQGW